MKVALGGDHRAVAYKETVKKVLDELGAESKDFGTNSEAPADYPDFAAPVARAVAGGDFDRGVLICGTGIGMSMAANKVKGIRAAVVHDEKTAALSREHNDANVLCVGSSSVDEEMLKRIVRTWMTTDFEGGRHARRVRKVMEVEG
jgi:ribose 5-phosphate isomerase B